MGFEGQLRRHGMDMAIFCTWRSSSSQPPKSLRPWRSAMRSAVHMAHPLTAWNSVSIDSVQFLRPFHLNKEPSYQYIGSCTLTINQLPIKIAKSPVSRRFSSLLGRFWSTKTLHNFRSRLDSHETVRSFSASAAVKPRTPTWACKKHVAKGITWKITQKNKDHGKIMPTKLLWWQWVRKTLKHVYIYIYIYIYTCTYIHIHIYVSILIYNHEIHHPSSVLFAKVNSRACAMKSISPRTCGQVSIKETDIFHLHRCTKWWIKHRKNTLFPFVSLHDF